MGGIFDVTQRLTNLAPRELASTVRRALQLETARLNLPFGSSHVTQRITVKDEGEDGEIVEVPEGLDTSLPPGRSLFRLKTTEKPDNLKSQLVKELRESPRPAKVLEEGGNYIVVWSKDAVGTEASKWIDRLAKDGNLPAAEKLRSELQQIKDLLAPLAKEVQGNRPPEVAR